ncbi:MAG: DNA repair protein RecN [Lachnospiraceae bacterium]|nr:DNA repair protein RecN [Lachnospiraceae bacterium]
MLSRIYVKDMALIRSAELELGEGLNILSGETGAGKSILIGSVNYCLGAKAEKDIVREGAEYALVELVFRADDEKTAAAIKAMELPVEEDGTLIISRRIAAAGRSSIKINGESVTAKQVKAVAELLIDIHGQHEHQSLLRSGKHLELLDAFGGQELSERKEECAGLYGGYAALKKKLDELSMDETARLRELSLMEYEIKEIEEAGIRIGEEDELEAEYRRIKKSRNSYDGIKEALRLTEGEGLLDGLGRVAGELTALAREDEALSDAAEVFSTAEDSIRDTLKDLERYMEEAADNAQRFDELEERLDLIRKLMLKYGGSEEAVLLHLEESRKRLEELDDIEAVRKTLEKDIADREKALDKCCGTIGKLRRKAADSLEKEICSVLEELNFLKVQFTIELRDKGAYSPDGREEAEFLISLNPGERMKPLKEVASGGELSRIMLALKTVFAARDDIGTLIFDEIDSGISGQTAWKVSEMMGRLARRRQLICITHLPQIAAMADEHFLIEKREEEGRTVTGISFLDEKQMVDELARMLGGDGTGEASAANARDLKERADAAKSGFSKTV